jgi:hypothetical protein
MSIWSEEKFDRERLVLLISQHLGIPTPKVIAGGTVRSDFIRAVATALLIKTDAPNTYKILEAVLTHLGLTYEPYLDGSEMTPTGGGGTITNHGYRKIARGIGAISFSFLIRLSESSSIEVDSITEPKILTIKKGTPGVSSLFEAGEGSTLVFFSGRAVGATYLGHASVANISQSDSNYVVELNRDFRTFAFENSTLPERLSQPSSPRSVLEVSHESLRELIQKSANYLTINTKDDKTAMSNEEENRDDNQAVPEEIEIRPEADALRIYAGLTYTTHYAIGEFIDNSISSAMQMSEELKEKFGDEYKLRISVNFDREANKLTIRDNAGGIAGLDLQSAVRAGSTNRNKKVGLGVYGVGMKASAFWFGTNLKIETFPLDESTGYEVSVDVAGTQHVADTVKVIRIPKTLESGTVITIGDIRGGIPRVATLNKTKSFLASIYRDYLGVHTHQGIELDCEILFDGVPLAYKEQKLLSAAYWPNQEGAQKGAEVKLWKKDIDITLSTGENIKGWVGILEQMSRFHSGFTLYYNDKAITGAGMAEDSEQGSKGASGKYKPAQIFGQVGSKLDQSFIGDFDISKLGKTITTDKPNWSDDQEIEFAEKVLAEIKVSPESMYAMAKNFRRRPNQRSVPSATEIEIKDIEDLKSIEANLTNEVDHGEATNLPIYTQPTPDDIDGQPGEIRLHDLEQHEHIFKIRMVRHRDSELLSLRATPESELVNFIDINLDHPMFDDLEETDIDLRIVIRRFCIAVAATKVFLDLADGDLFINKLNLMFRTMAGKGIEDNE